MKNIEYKTFADFCENTFDLATTNSIPSYQSLPLCILDDVFSLQANYDVVVKKVIQNYSNEFLKGNPYATNHTLRKFMKNIESCSSSKEFTDKYLHVNNKSCGRLKIELCYELARKLRLIGINNLRDFSNYPKSKIEIIEIIVKSVKGLKEQATNYLFMLAGDQNRVKVDTHVNKAVKAALGTTMNDADTQDLFDGAVKILNVKYPKLTMAKLDNIIWNYYHKT